MVKEAEILNDFQKVSYNKLQSVLSAAFAQSGKSYVDLASELSVKSVSTAQNVFSLNEQTVSDQILTKSFHALGIKAFVIWENGTRLYYIKN